MMPTMARTRRCAVLLAVGVGAVISGCSSGDDEGDRLDALEEEVADLRNRLDDSTSTTAATATTEVPTTAAPLITAPPPPEEDTTLAEATFIGLVNDHCDLEIVPDPNYATATVGGEGRFLIVDLNSAALVLDLNERVVYSTDGPDGVLPRDYSFGCDPEVFLGTAED